MNFAALGMKAVKDYFGFSVASNLKGAARTRLPKDGKTPLVDRLTDVLSPMYFDEKTNLFFLNDGGASPVTAVGRVYEIHPAVAIDDAMTRAIQSITALDFPQESVLSVSFFASSVVQSLLSDYVASRDPSAMQVKREASVLLNTMARERSRMFQTMAQRFDGSGHTSVRRFRVWLCVTCRTGEADILKWFSECKKVAGIGKVRQATRTAAFLSASAALEASLRQFSLLAGVWQEETLTQTAREILNPAATFSGKAVDVFARTSANRHDFVRQGFVYADSMLDVEKTRLVFTQAHNQTAVEAVTLGVTGYPTTIDINRMAHIAGSDDAEGAALSYPFLFTTVIEPTSLAQDKARVAVKHARVRQLAHTEIGQFLTDLGQRSQDLELALEACETGRGLARVAHTMMVYAPLGQGQRAAQAAKNVLSRMGFDAHVDAGLQMMGLMLSLPLEASASLMADVKAARRTVTVTKDAAANMLAMTADPVGSGARAGAFRRTPQLLLATRRGQLMPIDIFANRNGNFNAVVAGTSGSGKSVLAQELVMSMLATGGRVWVFDIGKSYQNCAELTQGQWIDFDAGAATPLNLNPLDMLSDVTEMLDELAQIVTVMANGTSPMELTESELLKQTITSVVADARSHARTPTFTDLCAALLAKDDAGLNDLAVRLMPYAATGRYARFFEGPSNIDFTSPLVVLEMESLANKPTLQNAVLLILMMRIMEEIKRMPRSSKKLIVIDEAWRLLSGNAGRFIEWACRTLRKYGAGIVCISQSMADFESTPGARAVRMNADTVFLMRQKKEGIVSYTSDPVLQRRLAGLTTRSEEFSEVYVRVGDTPGTVARLILDPFCMTAYSTRAEVYEAVRHEKEKGFEITQAIQSVSQRLFSEGGKR